MSTSTDAIEELATREYKYGFVTDVEAEELPPGLNEDIVRRISAKKNEPAWMLEWRLKAFRVWQTMTEPTWQNVHYKPINYQDIIYYSAPKQKPSLKSMDEVDPEVRKTFEKLGIPLEEQKLFSGVAVDAVFDSVSVGTTVQGEAGRSGDHLLLLLGGRAAPSRPGEEIPRVGGAAYGQLLRRAQRRRVFRRIVRVYPEGRPLPDGSCPRTSDQRQGIRQFERTLIVAEEGAYVSYLEGCTAPMRDEHQLHAAVWSWWRWTTPPSSTRRFRTGIPGITKARAASSTS
jgi:Fe-S cluster assembly protein SufB